MLCRALIVWWFFFTAVPLSATEILFHPVGHSNDTIQKPAIAFKLPAWQYIDQDDSVKFNIPEGFMNGNIIDIPVSISSDDTIYSMDFAIKFDFQNIEIDSVLNLTSGLQYLYHLNPNDSVFRFTSNRLIPIPNDSSILLVRFRTYTGQICAFDFDSLVTYLNGDPCRAAATGCLVTSQNELNDEALPPLLYPNPSTGLICFRQPFHEILVMNALGVILMKKDVHASATIDLSMLSKGIYFIRLDDFPIQKLILE
jgi:hypothetical protein